VEKRDSRHQLFELEREINNAENKNKSVRGETISQNGNRQADFCEITLKSYFNQKIDQTEAITTKNSNSG